MRRSVGGTAAWLCDKTTQGAAAAAAPAEVPPACLEPPGQHARGAQPAHQNHAGRGSPPGGAPAASAGSTGASALSITPTSRRKVCSACSSAGPAGWLSRRLRSHSSRCTHLAACLRSSGCKARRQASLAPAVAAGWAGQGWAGWAGQTRQWRTRHKAYRLCGRQTGKPWQVQRTAQGRTGLGRPAGTISCAEQAPRSRTGQQQPAGKGLDRQPGCLMPRRTQGLGAAQRATQLGPLPLQASAAASCPARAALAPAL